MIEDKLDRIIELLEARAANVPPANVELPEEPAADEPAAEDDPLDEPKSAHKKTVLADVQAAITSAVAKTSRDKVVAALAKFGAKRGTEVKESDFDKVVAALGKLK